MMTLNSTAFQQGGDIPSKYTCRGEAGIKDVSPPLAWEVVPAGAKSLVLIMDDFDAPDFVHWVVYNIPPGTMGLPENAARAGLPQGALHGLNDWADRQPPDPRATGYGGPCPPKGERHRYFHKLYALDIVLPLRDATKLQIEQAMRGRVLANAELIGRYPPTAELLSGSWTYRRFNPAFVSGNQTPEEKALIVADGIVLTLKLDATNPNTGLVGTIEWQGGGLDLRGTYRGSAFDFVGTGRPGTGTDGWEYHYDGHMIKPWPGANDERPTLLGSVIRAKPHGDRKAGEVFSFIAVRPRPSDPNESWHFPGMWTYRSFRNERKYPYLTAPPTARGLILQEAVLKLETPTSTNLRGTLEWGGGIDPSDWRRLDLQPVTFREPSSFDAVGIAAYGTSFQLTDSEYRGHLTRNWPNEDPWGVADQRPALVGSVIILAEQPRGPTGSVYPFIAVKQ